MQQNEGTAKQYPKNQVYNHVYKPAFQQPINGNVIKPVT